MHGWHLSFHLAHTKAAFSIIFHVSTPVYLFCFLCDYPHDFITELLRLRKTYVTLLVNPVKTVGNQSVQMNKG